MSDPEPPAPVSSPNGQQPCATQPAEERRSLASKLQAPFAAALVVASLVVMVTCGRASSGAEAPSRGEPGSGAQGAPLGSAVVAPSSAEFPQGNMGSASAQPLGSAAPPGSAALELGDAGAAAAPGPLEHFHAALAALTSGERSAPVRVAWLGDSHTAADFWTDSVRKQMGARYGVGGPGFVYVGLSRYRHASLAIEVDGKWSQLPSQPASSSPLKDPTLGLGGIRTAPVSADARVRLRLREGALKGQARWSLWYRMPDSASRLGVSLGGDERRVTARRVGEVEQLQLSGPASAALTIARRGGQPELFGLTVEGSEPGIVVDTLGINGARVATALAWGRESFVSALRARAPSLVVMAYGTNEAGANTPVERYREHFRALLERVREAAPEASCALFGPTDWVRGGRTLPRIVEIDALERVVAQELGCAYFSTFEAMGGEESALRWSREVPPLAAQDLIHLTPKGYGRLGERAFELLAPAGSQR